MSAVIFAALAVAWAVYLIPKALRQADEATSERKVESFSGRLRVLARREPVDRKTSQLVVPGRPAAQAEIGAAAPPGETPMLPAVRVARARARAQAAAKRRLRVVLAIVAVLVVVAVLAAVGVIGWLFVAVPVVVLLAWLVACRVMVRSERSRTSVEAEADPHRSTVERASVPDVRVEDSRGLRADEIDAVPVEARYEQPVAESVGSAESVEAPAQPAVGGWDPVETPLPTYVGQEPAARRSVRTIDLESTGVWTSGRTAVDAALAREADESARAERTRGADQARAQRRRASGS